jgi:hypothetical protein
MELKESRRDWLRISVEWSTRNWIGNDEKGFEWSPEY